MYLIVYIVKGGVESV